MKQSDSIFGELNFTPHWYALRTKFRHEKKVASRLENKGIINYLPVNASYRRWSDRYKKIDEPLFSCYVFVFIPLSERLLVVHTEGAARLVFFNGKPAIIPNKQIDAIKKILESDQVVQRENFFREGQRVRICRGTLSGIEGIFVRNKNGGKLMILVDTIKQAISIEINANNLEPL